MVHVTWVGDKITNVRVAGELGIKTYDKRCREKCGQLRSAMVGRVLEFGICRDVCLVIIMSHYKGKNVVHYNQDSMLHRKKGLSRPLTDDSYGAYASFPHLDHQFNTQYVFNTSLLSCRRAPSIIHNLSLATRYSCRQLQDIRASSSVF